MNKLLLSALTVAMLSGTAMAYETASPGIKKSLRDHVPFTTLVTSEKKTIPVLEGSADLKANKKRALKLEKSSKINLFDNKAATRAEEEPYMDFSYAEYDVQGWYSYENFFGSQANIKDLKGVYLCIYFSEYYTKMYNNCRIKDLSFVTGGNFNSNANELTEATVFISEKIYPDEQGSIDLSLITDPAHIVYEEPYEDITTKALALQTLPLKEEYVIKEGEPFVIGYEVFPQSLKDAFAVTDGVPVNYAIGSLIGFDIKRQDVSWGALGSEVGNLCIYLKIVGDDLPKDGLTLYDFEMPLQVNPGEEFDATVHLENANSNDVTSFEYTVKVGNQETETKTYELPEPLPYGSVLPFNLSGLKTEEVGLNIPFEFIVTKVNGVDNYYTTGLQALFKSFEQSKGFETHALIEEATSTFCGWCPIGISMMEYATKYYPDYYTRAVLHYDMGENKADPMYVVANNDMGEFFEYLPTVYISRWLDFNPEYYASGLNEFKETFGQGNAAAGIVDLKVLPAEDKATTITADVKFALDIENADRYRLGFYITEDGLGPYKQLNYYSGMSGDYDGWQLEPDNVKVDDFNDVVREVINAAEGCENSLPVSIKAGETYTYSVKADLSDVKGDTYNVIAFILDKEGQEILNSAVLTTDMAAAVEGIEAVNAAKVYGVNNGIVIKGEYNNAEVISIDGKKMAEVSGKEYVKLASGIYIVKVDGKTTKVVVK
ncbi:MAG: hypothetical protein K2L34_01405 [Muribaculaceae bacterium]|nr:hypothetical protein [Muribaculaceae bacterium]